MIFSCAALLALCQAKIVSDKRCGNVNEIFHKEVLVTGYKGNDLAIDVAKNTLFFIDNIETPDDGFKSVYLDLKTKKHEEIHVTDTVFTYAVDNRNNIVYMGSSFSISMFDYQTKKAVSLYSIMEGIKQMFFKDGLYFTTFLSEKGAYLYKNGVVNVIEELNNTEVQEMGVDNNFNIFFSNSSGLFVYKKDSGVITGLGDYVVNAFTSDSIGNLYFSTGFGLYSVDENLDIKTIYLEDFKDQAYFNMKFIKAMAVEDEKSIIYSIGDSIVRLTSRCDCTLKGESYNPSYIRDSPGGKFFFKFIVNNYYQ